MSLNSLVEKLVSTEKFQSEYKKLLLYSVRNQFENILYESSDVQIDYNYLITCASLLAQSKNGQDLDSAYRICQTGISNCELPDEYRSACASILHLLSNLPTVKLAREREYINDDYLKNLPIHSKIDITKKQFDNTIMVGQKFVLLNNFQKEVYEAFRQYRYLSISAPTSVGKSYVLLKIIEDFVNQNDKAKIVYIVPTRALIQQVEMDVRATTKENRINADVSSIPLRPDKWDAQANILVLTQERLQWLLNENPDISIDLIIVDEAQKIGDGSRGVLLQQVLQQTASLESTQYIFASPMCENPSALLNVLNKDNENENKEIVSEFVTVNQNLIWVSRDGNDTTKWKVELISNGEKMLLGHLNSSRITKSTMRLPVLSFLLSGNKKGNLIYCNTAADAEKIATQIMSQVQASGEVIISQKVKNLIALVKKTIHPNYVLSEVLKAGVAFHYGNMPLSIRSEIESLFKSGDITHLVCTSTLVEGVNLPAKTIYTRGPQKGRNVPMSEIDFWNLAGRAGRQGKEFQGNIICLDTDDLSTWKLGVPFERKKYSIKSTVDSIVEFKLSELRIYITSGDKASRDPQLDYCYTYFLTYYLKYGSISNSPIQTMFSKEVCESLDEDIAEAIKCVEIPQYILVKNQGINPIAQQRLFEYFKSSQKTPDELIPPYPEAEDAQDKYMHIIGRISSHINNDSYLQNMSHAILVTQWMRGYGLARIIASNIKWYKDKGKDKNLQAIIRDTMRDIEEFARFKFLKYSNCYIDVLKYYFASIGDSESIAKIPQINLWLEFGASQQTQISLMSMGFTRTAALELSDLMVATDMSKDDCLRWLIENDYHSMSLSATIMSEIDTVMNLQPEA